MDKITIKGPLEVSSGTEESITFEVKDLSHVSDGYHTIQELYDHRCLLFLAFLRMESSSLRIGSAWKSRSHNDGSQIEGWFIAGCSLRIDMQFKDITYHLPNKYWNLCYALELPKAYPWDGHTPADVLKRLEDWLR